MNTNALPEMNHKKLRFRFAPRPPCANFAEEKGAARCIVQEKHGKHHKPTYGRDNMNTYIFYTTQGYTIAPKEDVGVEITEAGFDTSEITGQQILTKTQ